MSLDIKQTAITAKRHSFANLQRRRGGEDKPASRYDEGVMDVQATANFHYRPMWAPEFELYDTSRTKVVMADWYALRDARQLYYATYNISRATMSANADRALELAERGDMLNHVDPKWRESFATRVVPMRHYEWGANLNSWFIADYGYGTAITSASAFAAADRLGMTQMIGRIGLVLDNNTGTSLAAGRKAWLDSPSWQPLRHAMEDVFVVKDWFETFVAQNVALDGILHPLVFDAFDAHGRQHHDATALGMVTSFMPDWYADQQRWVDGVLARAISESAANRALIAGWATKWIARAVAAATPIATENLGAATALAKIQRTLEDRLTKAGV